MRKWGLWKGSKAEKMEMIEMECDKEILEAEAILTVVEMKRLEAIS